MGRQLFRFVFSFLALVVFSSSSWAIQFVLVKSTVANDSSQVFALVDEDRTIAVLPNSSMVPGISILARTGLNQTPHISIFSDDQVRAKASVLNMSGVTSFEDGDFLIDVIFDATIPKTYEDIQIQVTSGNEIESLLYSFHVLTPGDANGNGHVEMADFLALADNFNKTLSEEESLRPWEKGDFNGDGVVSFADFLTVQATFGNTGPALPDLSSYPTTEFESYFIDDNLKDEICEGFIENNNAQCNDGLTYDPTSCICELRL